MIVDNDYVVHLSSLGTHLRDGNGPIAACMTRKNGSTAMIATKDIGAYAAERLAKRDFSGKSVQDLLGQRDLSLNEAGAIIGKKLGMTRIFEDDGRSVSVTVIEAGPCFVVQKKTSAKDGYEAVQVGFARKPLAKCSKPAKGHLEKHGSKSGFGVIREFKVEGAGGF